jgi:hypothetical protein
MKVKIENKWYKVNAVVVEEQGNLNVRVPPQHISGVKLRGEQLFGKDELLEVTTELLEAMKTMAK